jgi:hypothetical protein
MHQIPCKSCPVFPICKTKVLTDKENNDFDIELGAFGLLSNCTILTHYVYHEVVTLHQSRNRIENIEEMVRELFRERGTAL